jgi:hypothetical protein
MEPEDSLPHKQKPATCPYTELPPRHLSLRSILISSPHLRPGLLSDLLPSGFFTKILYAPFLSPSVLHSLPISYLIRSCEWYFVRSTEHKALCYVVFSTPLLPRPSWAQISFSALYSRKPSAYIPPSVWATNFHLNFSTPFVIANYLEFYECVLTPTVFLTYETQNWGFFGSVVMSSLQTFWFYPHLWWKMLHFSWEDLWFWDPVTQGEFILYFGDEWIPWLVFFFWFFIFSFTRSGA